MEDIEKKLLEDTFEILKELDNKNIAIIKFLAEGLKARKELDKEDEQ